MIALMKVKLFTLTSEITQLTPLPQPLSILWREKICMYSWDTAYRQFSNTPEEKFQDKKIMIRLIQKQRSTINKGSLGI